MMRFFHINAGYVKAKIISPAIIGKFIAIFSKSPLLSIEDQIAKNSTLNDSEMKNAKIMAFRMFFQILALWGWKFSGLYAWSKRRYGRNLPKMITSLESAMAQSKQISLRKSEKWVEKICASDFSIRTKVKSVRINRMPSTDESFPFNWLHSFIWYRSEWPPPAIFPTKIHQLSSTVYSHCEWCSEIQ